MKAPISPRPVSGARRVALLIAVAAVTLSCLVVGPPRTAKAASAPRVTGVEYVLAQSPSNSDSPKRLSAVCPPGKRVVGGSVVVRDSATPNGIYANTVTLTRLAPVTSPFLQNSYAATAVEAGFGTTGPWYLEVRAVCADQPSGYEPVTRSTLYSSSDTKTADAVCPNGKRALGSGAMLNILDSTGAIDTRQKGVGLQVARVDSAGGLVRTQAKEQPGGFAPNWQLVGYAICADTPAGFEVVTAGDARQGSETPKAALLACDDGKRLLGTGAATAGTASGRTAPPQVSLNAMSISSGSERHFFAQATENTFTDAPWTFIARAICVTR
jgi:hypothetical protein